MLKYRVFTNDVGPNQYSALQDVTADSLEDALAQAGELGLAKGTKFLCLPYDLMELWPHGVTGRVPDKALKYGAEVA